MLQQGDRVALVTASNGITERERDEFDRMRAALVGLGLEPVQGRFLFANGEGGTPQHPGPDPDRAAEMTAMLADDSIAAVFDVSGGDLAGGTLSYLDLDVIRENPKPYFGYSDLSMVVNTIHTVTGGISYLWNPRALGGADAGGQVRRFADSILASGTSLFDVEPRMERGRGMAGTVVGGNLRCLLKLAGTPYFPETEGRILVLEANSSQATAVHAGFHQLRQMGVLDRLAGLLLGTFTTVDRDYGPEKVLELITAAAPPRLPIASTRLVGHVPGIRAVAIGAPFAVDG